MYQRHTPEVFSAPRLMYLVYDPGPGPCTADIQLKTKMVIKITEHGYTSLSAGTASGKHSNRWDDIAWGESGSWLVGTLQEAMEIYRTRLLQRVTYRERLLAAAKAAMADFLCFTPEKPFFDEHAWEQVRLDVTRPARLQPPDNHNV